MPVGGTPASPPTCSARFDALIRKRKNRLGQTARSERARTPRLLTGVGFVLLVLTATPAARAQDAGPDIAAVEIVDFTIPESLTGVPGDAERGWAIVQNAQNATCLICHPMPMPWQPDHGNLAPDLTGVGNRYSAAEFRLRLVDPKVLNPFTIMPAYYRIQDLNRVQEKHVGQTIYSAQDIEDVIAYLLTLTEE